MKASTRIAVLLILFAAAAVYYVTFFQGYEGLSDGNDYAGLARSLSRGQGFNLGHLYPLAFAFGKDLPRPNDIWAPAYPLYLAFWFQIFGANDRAIMIGTVAAIWLFILASYLVGKRLFGEKWGLLAALLVGLNQSVLHVALEGSPEMLTGTLLTLSLLPLLGEKKSKDLMLSGFLFGLTVLSRYQMAALALPLLVFLIGRDLKSAGLWIAVALLTVSPWLVRNFLVLGNPFFTLQNYGEFTKGMGHLKYYYYTYRSFTPMTIWYAIGNFPFYMLKKFVAGIVFFGLNAPALVNFSGVIPLAYALRKVFGFVDLERRFILFTFGSAILVVILSSLDGQHWRHLVNLQAAIVVSMIAGLRSLFTNVRFLKDRYAQAAAVVLLFFPARFPAQEIRLREIADTVRASKQVYESIAEISQPGDVIISDASDAVWWYADRLSIWIPVVYSDLVKLIQIQPSRYVYLEKPTNYFSSMSDSDLADFYERVELVDGVEDGWVLYRLKQPDDSTVKDAINSRSNPDLRNPAGRLFSSRL